MRRLLIPATAALLVFPLLSGVATAQDGTVDVSLECYSNPERVIVTNNTTIAITVESVRSLDDPRQGELYRTGDRLVPGQSVTYESGTNATSHVLTRQHIFDNDAADEGALVVTSEGEIRVLCVRVTGVLGVRPSDTEPVAFPTQPPGVPTRPATPPTPATPPSEATRQPSGQTTEAAPISAPAQQNPAAVVQMVIDAIEADNAAQAASVIAPNATFTIHTGADSHVLTGIPQIRGAFVHDISVNAQFTWVSGPTVSGNTVEGVLRRVDDDIRAQGLPFLDFGIRVTVQNGLITEIIVSPAPDFGQGPVAPPAGKGAPAPAQVPGKAGAAPAQVHGKASAAPAQAPAQDPAAKPAAVAPAQAPAVGSAAVAPAQAPAAAVASGVTALPRTGGLPIEALALLGSLMTGAGVAARRFLR